MDKKIVKIIDCKKRIRLNNLYEKDKKLYIAYGSNLNVNQMSKMCPKAKPLIKYVLKDYKLEFKGYANIKKCVGESVEVLLWIIDKDTEKILDRYENYPKLYHKKYIKVKIKGRNIPAMVYIMNKGKINKPKVDYYNVIKQGYEELYMDLFSLEKALLESISNNVDSNVKIYKEE